MIKDTIKRLIIDMDKSLHSKIKVMSSKRGISIKEYITSIIIKDIIKSDYRSDIDNHV